jgi:hypothetical protein
MKKHKMFFGITILIACLAVVSVALSGSLPSTAFLSTKASSAPVANSKATQATPPRKNERPSSFLASPLDVERLTRSADLIVIGRVTGDGSFNVDKVVKGETASNVIKMEFQPEVPTVFGPIEPSTLGMYFLVRNANGAYRPAEPAYPFLITRADASLTEEPPLDRVVSIIGQVLLKPGPINDRRLAVEILSGAPTDAATELLRQAVRDKDDVIRMQSISALLNRGDVETLAIAEPILLKAPAKTDDYLLQNVASAVEGIKSPRAIPALQRLLRSSDSRTRISAISAIRHMHVQEGVEALVIALGDANRDVRYEAVVGLAELNKQDQWTPAVDAFAENEQRYLDHWKEWSRTR